MEAKYVVVEIDLDKNGYIPNLYGYETMKEAEGKMEALFEAEKMRRAEFTPVIRGSNYVNFGEGGGYYLSIRALRKSVLEEVMDTSNGHDPDLVKKINALWNSCRGRFEKIMQALYWRDLNEIETRSVFGNLPLDRAREMEELMNRWEAYAGKYLQNIADDKDLQLIIDFIG